MKKPLIGIVPLVDTERESYWMLPGYMKGIEEAGGIPFMLPLTQDNLLIRQLVEICDGILLTGGQDVSPEIYGEEKMPQCGEISIERDEMERVLLEEAIEKDKAVLGICRGIQFMNAILGGSLYQDLPIQKPSPLEHHQTPPYDKPVHEVIIEKNSPVYELLKVERLQVNSYHHQGVKKVSEKLKVMAKSTDGLVESVYMPGKKFIWATQWHPEFSYKIDESSRKIFECFIKSSSSK